MAINSDDLQAYSAYDMFLTSIVRIVDLGMYTEKTIDWLNDSISDDVADADTKLLLETLINIVQKQLNKDKVLGK